MTRPSRRTLARWLRDCNTQLVDETLPDAQRARLESRREHLRRLLVGSCSECGRRLEDPESIRLGIGPECARERVSA